MKREELWECYKNQENIIKGKWSYQTSSKNFSDVLDALKRGEKPEWLPTYLFFGEENFATDLKDVFYYDGSCFSVDENENLAHLFHYFIVDFFSTLVLYENPKDDDKDGDVVFHIYRRREGGKYSLEDIKNLRKKINIKPECEVALNPALVGKYEMCDQILESEIESYTGEVKTQDAYYILEPMFNTLDIRENGDAYVMNDDDEISLKASDGTIKIFGRENSKMRVSGYSADGIDFYINNFNGKKHWGKHRKVGDQEFLFVDLDCDTDIDEEIYVFKKVN